MGHSTSKTTETYNFRKRPSVTIEEALMIWAEFESGRNARPLKMNN
jgi:hypothetical protein